MAESNMSQASSLAAHMATFKDSIQGTQDAGDALSANLDANLAAASQGKLQTEAEENSAMGILIRTKKLEKNQVVKTEKARQAKESILIRKEDADGLAGEFSQQRGNREYHIDPSKLSRLAAEDLGQGINENSTPDEIIALVRRRMAIEGKMPDVAIVDKALKFLIEAALKQLGITEGPNKERIEKIIKRIETAKKQFFASHSIEIEVAEKIIGAVDAVVNETGQTVQDTLDRYRDVVHNPPDIQTLRKYYETKGFKAMTLELKGLSSYLGGNFKRTNLDNPELAQLAGAARKMQAMLGVFRQSKAHINVMQSYLELNGVLIEAA